MSKNKDLADVIYTAVEDLIRSTNGDAATHAGIVFAVSSQLAQRVRQGGDMAIAALHFAVDEGYKSGERARKLSGEEGRA